MDAARLLADGTTVTLLDGTVVPVRFDFESLMRLEVEFGSIFEWADQLPRRPLACVLAAVRAVAPARNITPAMLDSKRLTEYRRAVLEAWVESMPDLPAKAAPDAEGKAPAGSGTGAPSTDSPPSTAGAPKLTSVG
jgi:hypothetical protein